MPLSSPCSSEEEHQTSNLLVAGSIPAKGTTIINDSIINDTKENEMVHTSAWSTIHAATGARSDESPEINATIHENYFAADFGRIRKKVYNINFFLDDIEWIFHLTVDPRQLKSVIEQLNEEYVKIVAGEQE